MSVNKVIIVGNLGNDPKINHTDNGICVANISVATIEKWTDKEGNKQEKTEWHRCVAFRKTAEFIETYVQKGSQVYIEGKIRTRSWEDQEGVKKYATEIYIDSLQKLGKKSDNGSQVAEQQAETGGQTSSTPEEPETDDLPF